MDATVLAIKQVERARKCKIKDENDHVPKPDTPVKQRLRSASKNKATQNKDGCFFCDRSVSTRDHKASTKDIDSNVCAKATAMRESKLLGKLSTKEMFAEDCVHHKGCMTAFPTKYCSFMRQESQKEKNSCDLKPEYCRF